MDVVGFDINQERINELRKGTTALLEVDEKSLNQLQNSVFIRNNDLKSVSYFIVTVPTPVDEFKTPI